MTKLAFIGAGQMAEALLDGLLASKTFGPSELWAADVSAERRDLMKRRFGVRVGADNRDAVAWAEALLLAVKPQAMPAVLEEIGPAAAGRLVISIAAGVPIRTIAGRLPGARVARVMPNMPAMVREGIAALAAGPDLTEQDVALVRKIFEAVGRVVTVEEHLLSAVTAVSGSGPAFVFVALEALADGGVKMGLPRATADVLAAQTVLGAAKTVLETGEHPGRLKDRVASPGGTTIAGLHCLERDGFRAALIAAVEAATKRAQELERG